MSDRTIVALVLAACGLVLAAPLLGRFGAPLIADFVVGTAAIASMAAFTMAALATLRASRRRHEPPNPEKP